MKGLPEMLQVFCLRLIVFTVAGDDDVDVIRFVGFHDGSIDHDFEPPFFFAVEKNHTR